MTFLFFSPFRKYKMSSFRVVLRTRFRRNVPGVNPETTSAILHQYSLPGENSGQKEVFVVQRLLSTSVSIQVTVTFIVKDQVISEFWADLIPTSDSYLGC